MIQKIDEYFVKQTQNAYLWLFDRTGIYVGSLLFVLVAMPTFLASFRRPINAIDLIFVAVAALFILPYYNDQAKKRYLIFNARATWIQSSTIGRTIRYVFTTLPFFIFIIDLVGFLAGISFNMSTFLEMIAQLLSCSYMFLLCALIREREPKDWFKKRETYDQPAFQGSSNG